MKWKQILIWTAVSSLLGILGRQAAATEKPEERAKIRQKVEQMLRVDGTEFTKDHCRRIAALGEHAIDLLLEKLEERSQDERIRALYVLGHTRELRVVAPVARLVNDGDKEVAGTAIVTLGDIGLKECVEPVALALDPKKDRNAYWAVLTLFKLDHQSAIPFLVKFSSVCDEKVMGERFLKMETDLIVSILKRYHSGPAERKALLIELTQKEYRIGSLTWALERIARSKDAGYLPVLRELAARKQKTGEHMRYAEALKVIRELGAKLTAEEEKAVAAYYGR